MRERAAQPGPATFVIRGRRMQRVMRSQAVLAVSVVAVVLALALYPSEGVAPWLRGVLAAAATALVLLPLARSYVRWSRRDQSVALEGGQVVIRGREGATTVRCAEIGQLRLRAENPPPAGRRRRGYDPRYVIDLVDRRGAPIAQINAYMFAPEHLRAFVQRLRAECPGVKLDQFVQAFVSRPQGGRQ